MQTQDVGEVAILTSTWFDADGEPANPTTIVLTVTHPSGAQDSYNKAQLTAVSTSEYEKAITPDAAGVWRYTFLGTIDGNPVEQGGLLLVAVADNTGPCEQWATWDEALGCGSLTIPVGDPDPTPGQIDVWLDQATEIMYLLSGSQYPGICEATRSLCFACCGCYPAMCSCDPYPSVDLGGRFPVWGAWDVYVDGVLLDPSAYEIQGKRWLVRKDGQVWTNSGWNFGQDPTGFRVSWAYGRRPPAGGRAAAAKLALEIARRCVGDKTCALPSRVTNINREGVTFTVLDSMKMLQEGRTGVYEIDLWLMADQQGRKPRPHAFHPALGGQRRY